MYLIMAGGRIRPWQPEMLMFPNGGILILATQFAGLQKEQTSVVRTFFPGVSPLSTSQLKNCSPLSRQCFQYRLA
jgi:hypothetical protein